MLETMTIKASLIAALISLISPFASAAIGLEGIDQFLAGDHFQVAFRAGDQALVEKRSCVGSMCDHFNVLYKVISVDHGDALVQTVKSDGTVLEESHVLKADWENLQHNRLRQEIQSMESFGFQVEIKSIAITHAAVSVNGELRDIETRQVNLSGQNAAGMKTLRIVEISSGLGGIAQFLSASESKVVGTDSTTVLMVTRP